MKRDNIFKKERSTSKRSFNATGNNLIADIDDDSNDDSKPRKSKKIPNYGAFIDKYRHR